MKKYSLQNIILKIHWLLPTITIVLYILVGLLFIPWLNWIYPYDKTAPNISVLGVSTGSMNSDELNTKLNQLKSEIETREITLNYNDKKWNFRVSELGMTFDAETTKQSVWWFNHYRLIDRIILFFNKSKSQVLPIIRYNGQQCEKSISTINIPTISPKDAIVTLDNNQKYSITTEQTGSIFKPSLTCQIIHGQLTTGLPIRDIYLKPLPANITKTDIESKLPQIKALTEKSLSLKNAEYQLTLNQKQLLSLLEITKNGDDVHVGWSTTKLDKLINNIALKVNTNNRLPVLGSCQYSISRGGYRLDKDATKEIFQNLVSNSSRFYNLKLDYHKPVIGKYSPVAPGNRGTVYLTYDDGLAYGNQIMNYAACFRVKVTFFEIGARVGTDASALRRAIAGGHTVQSHGYEHAAHDYGERSYEWQLNDIERSVNAITGITGIRPTFFRPPGGNRSSNTYRAASTNGLDVILWGVSSIDTAGIGPGTICSNVLSKVYPGASILMHSSKPSTAAALPCIVKGLAARGYNMKALR